jgi:hypothetical protein
VGRVRLSHPLFSGPSPRAPVFDFRAHFCHSGPWKRTLSASDSGPQRPEGQNRFLISLGWLFHTRRNGRLEACGLLGVIGGMRNWLHIARPTIRTPWNCTRLSRRVDSWDGG